MFADEPPEISQDITQGQSRDALNSVFVSWLSSGEPMVLCRHGYVLRGFTNVSYVTLREELMSLLVAGSA
jgi:hypothetical protein